MLLRQVYELYLPAAEQRGLRLILDAPTSIKALVGKQRIIQAVTNLLDNALAYTPPHGNVTLGLERTSKKDRLVVRDTGPGVAIHELDRIWQRHARGSAASANTPGMGLGLSLVRAIANAHGGTTGCGNREEQGAEFWIELPSGDPLETGNAI